MAGVVGRPAAWLGGAAGRLARDNAMRNPGRTAVTASALMIGVALVTAVTIVAQGLEQQGRGQLEDTVQASTIVTATDGWSPIDPEIERALAGVRHRQLAAPGRRARVRQAGGSQRRRSGIDRRSLRLRLEGGTAKRHSRSLGRDGAIVNDGFASEHGLKVGSTFAITSMQGTQLNLTVRAIEQSPSFDVLSLGPITISHAAFDAAFDQQRNRLTFVDGPQDAVAKALGGLPERQGRGQGRLHRLARRSGSA